MREQTPKEVALSQLELTAIGLNPFGGFKFGEPDVPMGKLHETKFHMKHRYEEGIIQLTKLLMRDGKLSKAQRVSCGLTHSGHGTTRWSLCRRRGHTQGNIIMVQRS